MVTDFGLLQWLKVNKSPNNVPNQLHAEFSPPPPPQGEAEMGTKELSSKFMDHTV